MTEELNMTDDLAADRGRLHLTFGWWSLLAFLSLGVFLEAMHGFKVGWYLDVGNDTRRLMFTLAHAHGTLLGLVHIAFGLTAMVSAPAWTGKLRAASICLRAGSVCLPLGFFLGGVVVYGGDPGVGVFLVPPGAALVLVAVALTASGVRR